MNQNTRIQLDDTAQTAISKLAEGDPGALRICVELLQRGAEIDPDAFIGGMANLLSLDTHAIYGADIWTLYKDVCRESLPKMVGVLRAVQLGIESEAKLKHAIQNRGEGINVSDLFEAVCGRLPAFAAANALESDTVAA